MGSPTSSSRGIHLHYWMPRGIISHMPDIPSRPAATTVRLDPALRARLDEFAEATNRSLLGAITQLLTEALDARDAGARTPPHGTPRKDTP